MSARDCYCGHGIGQHLDRPPRPCGVHSCTCGRLIELPVSDREHLTAAGVAKRQWTKPDAKRHARMVGGLVVYRCRVCGWWHTGHETAPRRAS